MMRRFSLLLFAVCPAPVLAAASGAAPGVDGAAQAARVLGVLVLVVGLIFGLAALLRRHGGMQRRLPGAISVLSVASIGARERLLLVEVGGRQLLLGAAPGRIQTLLVLDEPVAPVEGAPGAPGFAAQLRTALGGMKGSGKP
ncbi:flagellar biosynthetic protein FliO [Thioalkalivibrio sp. XN279]|uniref:flagellar biosynthetic protein FliO n=1 Tax=Thioalkalivibrio sp. XN279 TaxID=2714953 RepID=UPI00140B4070|nr:flagellar biosynthetic protein FliO [Thioalkalivibrio sp. XN279]NHA13359.1 flagellar biosynthetic protein FliO [Thioalkalivibrio sp. XN279]